MITIDPRIPEFLANPFGWFFLAVLMIRYIVQFYISNKKDKTQKGEGGWHPYLITLFYVLILTGALYTLFFQFHYIYSDSTIHIIPGIIFIIGFLIYIFGAVVRILSLIELGHFYSENIIIRAEHKLVTSGIYAISRHPLHTGFLLELAGMVIFSQVLFFYIPWLLLPYIGFVWIMVVRTKQEELILNKEFGDDYKSYTAQVPGINIAWGILKYWGRKETHH